MIFFLSFCAIPGLFVYCLPDCRIQFENHLLPSVEPLTKSSFLMRPLISAVISASCPFLCDFLAWELPRVIQKGKPRQLWNALLPVYIFFASICMILGRHDAFGAFGLRIRMSFSIGKLGSRLSRFRWLVLPLQVWIYCIAMLLMGMVYVVSVGLYESNRGRQDGITVERPYSLLPILLVVVAMLWSAYFLRYLWWPCQRRRSSMQLEQTSDQFHQESYSSLYPSECRSVEFHTSVTSERSVLHL